MGRLPLRGPAPLLLVLVAVALAYLPSLSGGRVWDDNFLLDQDVVVAGRVSVWRAFQEPYCDGDYYRPVTALVLRGFNAAGGGGVILPKLFALCLHLGLTAFVYGLARRLGAGSTAALVAAALFGLHPALTETVAWVSCLGDLMAAAWLGGALLAMMQALGCEKPSTDAARIPHPPGAPKRWGAWTALSLLCFLMALLCKETAAMFPVIGVALLVGDRLGRSAAGPVSGSDRSAGVRTRAIGLITGQVVVFVVWYLFRASALQIAENGPVHLVPLGPSLRLALLGQYVELLFRPVGLSLLHVIDPPAGGGDLRLWLGTLGTLGFSAVTIWTARRRPRTLAPAAWVAAMLLPAVLLIPEGTGFFAERYLYIPAVGLAVLLAVFASTVADRVRHGSGPGARHLPASTQRILLAAAAVIAVVSFGLVWRRSMAWRSESVLFQDALAADPRAAAAAGKLGFAMRQAGHKDEALDLYERTLQAVTARPPVLTGPDRDTLRKMAYDAGLLLGERGDLPEAERALRLALQYDPTDERTLGTLGALLGQTGRYAEARAVLQAGVGIHPESKLIRRNLAVALSVLGDSSGAAAQYREILRQDPGDPEAAAFLRRMR